MKASPVEVHDLYNEGLSISEIARRLKISRASVNHKLRDYDQDKREYDLDNLKRELNEEKADLKARKAKVEAREREINKIPELEERAHLLESKVDSLTNEKVELEEEIRSDKEVLEEVKEYKGGREEERKQLSELEKTIAEKKSALSNSIDLQKRSAQKLNEIQRQIEIESLGLYRIRQETYKNRKENVRLVDENKHLNEENRVKKEAINEIEQSYYGFIELTKQIALYMPCGSAKKTKTHEEIRKKVLQGMEIIGEKAKIAKPELESDLQALLRNPTILKDFALENYPMKPPREQDSNHDDELK